MNYRDFFKDNKNGKAILPESVTKEELKKGIQYEMKSVMDEQVARVLAIKNLTEDSRYYSKIHEDIGGEEDVEVDVDDNGGLPLVGGALAVPHVGQPIHMSKIVQVGKSLGAGPASGELSGYTSAVPVTPDKEPITAGGKKLDSSLVTKSVGGELSAVSGEESQSGPNHGGTIEKTAKLQETKNKVKETVKKVLKEIKFDKQSGKWVRLDEGKHKAGCECAFCKNKGTFGKKKEKEDKKDELDENRFASMHPDDPEAQHPAGQARRFSTNGHSKLPHKPFSSTPPPHDPVDRKGDAGEEAGESPFGENTVNMKMGPSYKKEAPQYRTAAMDAARTKQYDPEITEMYDEEEESMKEARLSELMNAQRNLTSEELSELKKLHQESEVKECNLADPNGTSYKVVSPTQVQTAAEDHARSIQHDPHVTEDCSCGDEKDEMDEAGGMSVQHRSYRTEKDNPQHPDARWSDEVYESTLEEKEKWMQKGIDPSHKGYCTPMTKSTCIPRRKALAKRFKSGDLSETEKKSEVRKKIEKSVKGNKPETKKLQHKEPSKSKSGVHKKEKRL